MDKLLKLEQILMKKEKVAVAFSGGIDSSFLLAFAKKVLGKENVIAIVVNSELFRDSEYKKAFVLAEELGVKVVGTSITELIDFEIVNNTPNGWYRSKKILYQAIKTEAYKEGYSIVLDGMIMDDQADYRPGLRARDEEGIESVLQQANLYKTEIREFAKKMRLPIWDKPASCSVASRFPYYTEITEDKVKAVMNGEKLLNDLGFPVVRLRHHGNIARIEIEEERLVDFINARKVIESCILPLGFDFVTLDISGYRMGRMNEELVQEKAV